jgi:hypothetical protein
MNTMTDLKLYLFNAAALAFNFTNIDIFLKMFLSAVVVGYTIHKWVIMNEDRAAKKESKKQEDAAKNKYNDHVK